MANKNAINSLIQLNQEQLEEYIIAKMNSLMADLQISEESLKYVRGYIYRQLSIVMFKRDFKGIEYFF